MSAPGAVARRILALVSVAALVSCSSGTDEPGGSAGTAAVGTTVDVPGAELVGRWAHYDIVAYQDSTMKTMIISYGFTDFRVQDGQLIEAEEFCFADQVSDLPVETSISDAATQAIRPPATPVEVSGSPGAWRVRRPATPTPVGIRLDDPANERLPTDPNDPRVVDDDADGKPGITVQIGTGGQVVGELYLARREIFAYDLQQVGPDRMEGTVTDSSEQLVIGASVPELAQVGGQWEQVADPALSPIQLRRVGDDWGCDRLRTERPTLFPPDPPVRW